MQATKVSTTTKSLIRIVDIKSRTCVFEIVQAIHSLGREESRQAFLCRKNSYFVSRSKDFEHNTFVYNINSQANPLPTRSLPLGCLYFLFTVVFMKHEVLQIVRRFARMLILT